MESVHETTKTHLEQLEQCVICCSSNIEYTFTFQGYPVWQCHGCESLFLNPQPSDYVLNEIYGSDYFLGENTDVAQQERAELKRATARNFLANLQEYRNHQTGRLLEIGCGQGEFLQEAEALGYSVTGVEVSQHAAEIAQENLQNGEVLVGNIEQLSLPLHSFDVIVSTDVIEHLRNPREHLEAIHKVLKPGGVLMLVTISLDSWTARLLRHKWMEFKIEHLTYYSNNALQSLLLQSGFHHLRINDAQKTLTAKYIMAHFERYPVPIMTTLLKVGYTVLPEFVRSFALKLSGSGVMLLAQAQPIPERRKLSIVIPAYNEAATFSVLMDRILDLEIDDLDIEYIIVESNSTDGTRELAQGYAYHEQVTLILQDKPQGKGYAVRTGLEQAIGDFVVIQDADLEYDLTDYPKLLRPLMSGERTFVLGSRHGTKGAWNMRQFEAQVFLSSFLNFGHVLFAFALNVLYGQKLDDPFTMYKVFWRDCLDGLTFESKRFDFDFELVIKLLRKGYQPKEIPVSYESRGFDEGKKVSIFLDPLTWIWALIKFRFVQLFADESTKGSSDDN